MSMTKKNWVASAKPITIQVEGQSVVCTPRQFSSGLVGYNASGKVLIDGHKVQVGGNLVVVGFKDWPNA